MKLPQVSAGVVVTVVQGGTSTAQHVALSHVPLAQTIVCPMLFHPLGQEKLLQVGAGVVVTVVMTAVQQVAESHAPI